MEDRRDVVGFLGTDGVPYCSRACASRQGKTAGYEVDQDEYESLVEGQSLQAAGLCPGCGAGFAVSWPERDRS